jgi:hypothetical protein
MHLFRRVIIQETRGDLVIRVVILPRVTYADDTVRYVCTDLQDQHFLIRYVYILLRLIRKLHDYTKVCP